MDGGGWCDCHRVSGAHLGWKVLGEEYGYPVPVWMNVTLWLSQWREVAPVSTLEWNVSLYEPASLEWDNYYTYRIVGQPVAWAEGPPVVSLNQTLFHVVLRPDQLSTGLWLMRLEADVITARINHYVAWGYE